MDDQQLVGLFTFLSYSPGPFWMLLLLAPNNKWSSRVFDCFLFFLSALFAIQTIPMIPELLPLVLKPEFDSLHRALSTNGGFVGTWNHMILADLWIGRWVALDISTRNQKTGASLLLRLCFLPGILVFGPFGLCLYLLYRTLVQRRFWLIK